MVQDKAKVVKSVLFPVELDKRVHSVRNYLGVESDDDVIRMATRQFVSKMEKKIERDMAMPVQ